MYDDTGIKAIKAIDPVWKRLRFDRIWKLLFLAYILIYLIFSAENFWRTEGAFAIFVIFFLTFGIVGGTINQFRWERYWKRIGQRRLEALRDPQPFVAGSQPWPSTNALPLPATIRLRWRRATLGVAVALIIVSLAYYCLRFSSHRITGSVSLLLWRFQELSYSSCWLLLCLPISCLCAIKRKRSNLPQRV